MAVPHEILGQARVGSEFQVNTYTPDSQFEPSVARAALGDFVVVWTDKEQDGSDEGVFGQRFSSAGAALGGEFQVNERTVARQQHASLASDADGDFVIAWEGFGGQDGESSGIFARRFSSAGVPLASEFQVNTHTPSYQIAPSVAAKPDGDFVVVWRGEAQGDFGDILGQRFSSEGIALASEFQVNTFTTGIQSSPSVAMSTDGRFVVAWDGYLQYPANSGVVAQRFSSEGAPLGGEIQVNTYTLNDQQYPTVAVHADGGFVVTWESSLQDGSGRGVFARGFASAGDALGGELQISAYTEGYQSESALAVAPDGGFIVVWTTFNDAGGDGAFARRFTSAGTPLTSQFRVNTYTFNVDIPAIGIDSAGNFVVAWGSDGQEGVFEENGIFAQRFTLATPSEVELDIDGDGETDALTDGLLILRRLFGFTGATLINGAVDTANCSRCAAEDVESYIDGLGLALDIDGDTDLDPLTDGLLALRYLFGFTGTTLTSGAVNTGGCARCDAGEIEPYLLGLDS